MHENEIPQIVFDAMGLLINFNVNLFKKGYRTILNGDVAL